MKLTWLLKIALTIVASLLMLACPPAPAAQPVASPPAAPEDVSLTAANTMITLHWKPVLNATGYNIYYSSTSGVTISKALQDKMFKKADIESSIAISGLANATTYYFALTACNEAGESALSREVSGIPKATPQVPSAPASPQGLTAHIAGKLITLGWQEVEGATGYKIFRVELARDAQQPDSNAAFELLATALNISSYKDSTAEYSKKYAYRLASTNLVGDSLPCDPIYALTVPLAPANLRTKTATHSRAILITWDQSPSTEFYGLYRSKTHGFDPDALDTHWIQLNSSTEYLDQGLEASQSYFYRVVAINSSGTSELSAELATRSSP